MPRKTRAFGRPGTRVIPANWQDDHAGVIAQTFDCRIRIAPAGTTPQWNAARRQTETLPGVPLYVGKASVGPISDSDRDTEVVDEKANLRRYDVMLEVDVAGIDPDTHFVFIDDSPDPDLVGQRLSIDSVERGGRRFSRVLIATLND